MASAFEVLAPNGHKRLVDDMKDWTTKNVDSLVEDAVDKAMPYKLAVRDDEYGHKRVALVGVSEE